MKIQVLSVVSMVMVLAGGVVGCAADGQAGDSEPSGATASEIHAGNDVSLTDFTKAMTDEENGMDGADGCTFTTKSTASGLVIELTDKNGKLTLTVGKGDQITHKDRPDGDSSVETYQIAGVGSVELVHADDAFEQVNVTSAKTKKTASCEVDF
jgi:hypothetical protein